MSDFYEAMFADPDRYATWNVDPRTGRKKEERGSMSAMIPDPDGDGYLIGSASEHTMGAQVGAAVLRNVHSAERCEGRPCVVHHPSDHHMRGWDLNWRDDRALMERLCPAHGVGHPDPDDLAWRVSQGHGGGVHGCCGCCGVQEVAA